MGDYPYFCRDPQLLVTHAEVSICSRNQLDPFNRFDAVCDCDRQTHKQTNRHVVAYNRLSCDTSRGNNKQNRMALRHDRMENI